MLPGQSPSVSPQTERNVLFRDLFASESSYVWSTLRRLGVRRDDLEDLTHDVLIAAYQQLDVFDRSRAARPWLFGIAFRIVSAHRRRMCNRREQLLERELDPIDDHPGAQAALEAGQARQILHGALDELSLEVRATFVLAELDEVPMKEVAASLGIPLNTAYSRVRLAREQIERSLRRQAGEGTL